MAEPCASAGLTTQTRSSVFALFLSTTSITVNENTSGLPSQILALKETQKTFDRKLFGAMLLSNRRVDKRGQGAENLIAENVFVRCACVFGDVQQQVLKIAIETKHYARSRCWLMWDMASCTVSF